MKAERITQGRALNISPMGQVALQRWLGLARWSEAELGFTTG